MQIFCDFCGAAFDITNNSVCPNCGADMSENKQLKQYRKLAAEQNKINLQQAKLRTERMQNQVKAEKTAHKISNVARLGCLIPIALLILGSISAALIGIFGITSDNNANTKPTEIVYVEPHHNATYGELVKTRDYTIVLDKCEYYKPNSYAIHKGEMYIKLHFEYTNITEQKIYDDNHIYCYDDNGKQCKTQYSISEKLQSEKFDSQTVMPGKSYSGWLYYIVPEGTNKLTVTYGESVEFVIDITSNPLENNTNS